MNKLLLLCVAFTLICNFATLYLNLTSIRHLRDEKRALEFELSAMWNAIKDLREQQKQPTETTEVVIGGEVCQLPNIKKAHKC